MSNNEISSESKKRARKQLKCGICGQIENDAHWKRHFIRHHDSAAPVLYVDGTTILDPNEIDKVRAKVAGSKFKKGASGNIGGAPTKEMRAAKSGAQSHRPIDHDCLSIVTHQIKRQRVEQEQIDADESIADITYQIDERSNEAVLFNIDHQEEITAKTDLNPNQVVAQLLLKSEDTGSLKVAIA